MKTAIILYEPEHLASFDVLMAKWSTRDEKPTVVSLDAEIDYTLEKRGVTFISGKMLQNRTTPDSYMRSDELTREICEDKSFSFLQYRGISLLRPLRLSIHQYFQILLYYIDVIERFMESAPDVERLVVPTSVVPVSKTSGPLGIEEAGIAVEAVRRVAEGRRTHYELYNTVSVSLKIKNHWQEWVFGLKRSLFGVALAFLNVAIGLRPRRPIRIIASDYWRNLSPILGELPEAELILLDRSEAIKAGLANIWRYKMRFMHIGHFLSRKGKQRALVYAGKCKEEWAAVRKDLWASADLSFRGADLRATSEKIMARLVEHAVPDIICDIEGTYAMYERLSPDVVLLRASVSGQRHFAILPLVAREAGVPALEVQHGGEYLGPGSPTREHPSEFLAVYGKLVAAEFEALGYDQKRLLVAGSPRFDAYVKNRKEKVVPGASGVSILSNTPAGNVGERYGTYSIEEYFHALGDAVRAVPNAHLSVASRSSAFRSNFLKGAWERGLEGVSYESVGDAPLPELFAQADIFVCSHSTVVYEALLCGLPVIIASSAPVEKMMTDFHFSRFRDAGALAIAHTPEELREIVGKLATDAVVRERMSAAAEAFMAEQFSFDGYASERIATQVRMWAGVTRAES